MKATAAAAVFMITCSTLGCIDAEAGDSNPSDNIPNASQTQTVNGLKPEYVRNTRLLTDEGIRTQLLGNPLSTTGLTQSITDELRVDSHADLLMHYIVRCALPTSAKVVVSAARAEAQDLVYQGEIGLAPGWESGPASEEMRAWISACVLAHTNYDADHMMINLVGPQEIGQGSSYEGFPVQEGTYWGDIFAADNAQKRFACALDPTEMSRVCKDDARYCGDYLHGAGENRSIDLCSRTCSTRADDGGKPNSAYFTDCKVGGETFTKTITVYRSN